MKKILVVRNDKIGDFMLAWPSFAMLKASLPDCHVTALVPNYTVALAQVCPWIDNVMVDPTVSSSKHEQKQLITKIQQENFDASINLFSTYYNAHLVWKAKVPYRLAPATKIAQIFYNHRIKQKRSKSTKPEFEYNLDLVRAFLQDIGKTIVEPTGPYLTFEPSQIQQQKIKLEKHLNIDGSKPWVYVHAGSGGSANNLTLEQYRDIVTGISGQFEVVLTAGPGEEVKALELQKLIEATGQSAVVYDKNEGLVDFSLSIACANLFIAGSTGPLHIAAAIDVPTVGFFPSKRSSTPLRWTPLNSQGRHLAFCPPKGGSQEQEADMSRIDIGTALNKLNSWAAKYLF